MKKSKFNLSHLNSLTLDPGFLVPFLVQPTLPNDTFLIGLSTFLRGQPMLAPLMHEVRLFTQYWYVPNRLLWDEWEDFITGGYDLSLSPVFPQVTSNEEDAKVGSLWDYLGFPLEAGLSVSALPFRALAEIYNVRYRDEDLQEEVPISYASGEDDFTSRKLLSPSISKDYFSIARPYTQRGADVFIPVTSGESSSVIYHKHTIKHTISILRNPGNQQAPLIDKLYSEASVTISDIFIYNIKPGTYTYAANKSIFMELLKIVNSYPTNNSNYTNNMKIPFEFSYIMNLFEKVVPGKTTEVYPEYPDDIVFKAGTNGRITFSGIKYELNLSIVSDATISAPIVPENKMRIRKEGNSLNSGWLVVFSEDNVSGWSGLFDVSVTLNSAGAISVRDIRRSSAMQRYAERSLRWGNRYEEFIQREFGVSPRDSRIQRPEYIGGGSGLLNISEVLQTAESTDTGVGTMRGHSVGAINQKRIKFKSPEHGLIIGLLSIRPKTVYTQGIEREFLKKSRLDFFTPEFANIGMQEVLTQELYAVPGNEKDVFGYSERYQEYRYHKPLVVGEFRDNLSFWNMALKFASQPELNAEFLDMKTYLEDFKRPFQIQDNSAHAFVCMLKNHVRAYRPIPKRAKDILR